MTRLLIANACKYARKIDPTAEITHQIDSVRKYGNRAGSSFARSVTPSRKSINKINQLICVAFDRGHGWTRFHSDDAYDELKNLCVWTKDNGGMGSFYRRKSYHTRFRPRESRCDQGIALSLPVGGNRGLLATPVPRNPPVQLRGSRGIAASRRGGPKTLCPDLPTSCCDRLEV
jgi:hypothetical protein